MPYKENKSEKNSPQNNLLNKIMKSLTSSRCVMIDSSSNTLKRGALSTIAIREDWTPQVSRSINRMR